MTLRYNANLVSEGAIKDSEGNKITTTYAKLANIGDGTITITQGGVTKGTFTTNQSGDATIALDAGAGGGVTDVEVNGTSVVSGGVANISVPTNNNQLSNGAGYITGINSSDVTTALGYSPENQANKVTAISSSSTDTQYTSAKCVYDELANKADKNLSNLTATSSTNFDGQFVQKYLPLDNHTSKGSWGYNLGQTDVVVDGTTYSARNYLPDNNYIYIVYGQLEVVSANDTFYYVGTGKEPYSDPSNMFFATGRTHSSGNRQENFFCFPIVPNASGYQFIYDQIAVNAASTGARTTLVGYRRIGTNS